MIKNSKVKGYLFAFITTITLSNVYIFSKAALIEVNLYQFGFYWFGFAIVWNLIYSVFSGHFKTTKKPSPYQWWNFFGIGVVEVIATSAIFIAINIIPNPTIPAFVRNLEPVLIVFLAIIISKVLDLSANHTKQTHIAAGIWRFIIGFTKRRLLSLSGWFARNTGFK